MSNKHEMKLMEYEVNNLRNQVFYLNGLLDKITEWLEDELDHNEPVLSCLLYTSPSPRDLSTSRMPSSA